MVFRTRSKETRKVIDGQPLNKLLPGPVKRSGQAESAWPRKEHGAGSERLVPSGDGVPGATQLLNECSPMHKHAAQIVIAVISLFFAACTTTTPIADLETAGKDQPIQVVTKDGARYRFEKWALGERRSVIGFVRNGAFSSTQWETHVVPADSILSIESVDTTMKTVGEVTLTSLGAIGGLVFLWTLARAFSLFSGFSL